jgi:multidrug efflux system outer membrane protein
VDFLSVLDAQRELYADEDLAVQSQTTVTTDLIALYRALGGGWSVNPAVSLNNAGSSSHRPKRRI